LQSTQVSTHEGIWQHELLSIFTSLDFININSTKFQLVHKILKTTNPDFLIMLQYFDMLLFSFKKSVKRTGVFKKIGQSCRIPKDRNSLFWKKDNVVAFALRIVD